MRAWMALMLVVCVVEGKWWMDQPYGDDDYNIRVEYGEEINITCDDPRLGNQSYTVEFWVLPDLTIMRANDRKEFKTFDGLAGWEVNNDASKLRLFIVTEDHFGFYHCLVNTSEPINDDGETHLMVKRATNYKGPYFDDLWGEYQMNVIIGCSSAAAFLVISSAIYGFFIWWGQKKAIKVGVMEEEDMPEMEEIEKQDGSASPEVGNGVANDVFTTKMETALGETPAEMPVVEQPQPTEFEPKV